MAILLLDEWIHSEKVGEDFKGINSWIAAAALSQDWMRRAPAILLIAGVFERTARKYGSRATQYVHFEAGCAAQNAALQGAALIGSVVVGAFEDAEVGKLAGLSPGEGPIVLLPIGREQVESP